MTGCRSVWPNPAQDFYDLWILAKTYKFKDDRLAGTIAANFRPAQDRNPYERPDEISAAFANDPTKQKPWVGFIEEVAVSPCTMPKIIENLNAFLMPHAEAATRR